MRRSTRRPMTIRARFGCFVLGKSRRTVGSVPGWVGEWSPGLEAGVSMLDSGVACEMHNSGRSVLFRGITAVLAVEPVAPCLNLAVPAVISVRLLVRACGNVAKLQARCAMAVGFRR